MALKISIITPSFNSQDTIDDTIKSVLYQSNKNIEYIIIDGGSTDETVDIIKRYEDKISYWVSKKDNGIYDAMNKGISVATGEIIGILNSDDFYADEFVIEDVVKAFDNSQVESCYGDLVYVDRKNTGRVIRYWKSGYFSVERFKRGWMAPHPTFFARRSVYEKYGLFRIDLPIAADYELMLRFLYRYGVSTVYIPRIMVKMRKGGNSSPSIINTIKSNAECYKAWRRNGLTPTIFTFILKPTSKIFQYVKRENKSEVIKS